MPAIATRRPSTNKYFSDDSAFQKTPEGIHVPKTGVAHRDDEFDETHIEMLLNMQKNHFWYRGRHRILLRAVQTYCSDQQALSAIDLGGGCGGWIQYVQKHGPNMFDELSLADSSPRALSLSESVVGKIDRYQIDLHQLPWRARWDVAFLLDVLEHLPDDAHVLSEITKGLKPGGLLFVTTPALPCFWSYNDDLVHHLRRYTRSDFRRLAASCGLELCLSRYFMTFLSPLLLLSRLKRPDFENTAASDLLKHTHRVPAAPINELLSLVFAMETPIGLHLPFPWGTSVMGVFRKPTC